MAAQFIKQVLEHCLSSSAILLDLHVHVCSYAAPELLMGGKCSPKVDSYRWVGYRGNDPCHLMLSSAQLPSMALVHVTCQASHKPHCSASLASDACAASV